MRTAFACSSSASISNQASNASNFHSLFEFPQALLRLEIYCIAVCLSLLSKCKLLCRVPLHHNASRYFPANMRRVIPRVANPTHPATVAPPRRRPRLIAFACSAAAMRMLHKRFRSTQPVTDGRPRGWLPTRWHHRLPYCRATAECMRLGRRVHNCSTHDTCELACPVLHIRAVKFHHTFRDTTSTRQCKSPQTISVRLRTYLPVEVQPPMPVQLVFFLSYQLPRCCNATCQQVYTRQSQPPSIIILQCLCIYNLPSPNSYSHYSLKFQLAPQCIHRQHRVHRRVI